MLLMLWIFYLCCLQSGELIIYVNKHLKFQNNTSKISYVVVVVVRIVYCNSNQLFNNDEQAIYVAIDW